MSRCSSRLTWLFGVQVESFVLVGLSSPSKVVSEPREEAIFVAQSRLLEIQSESEEFSWCSWVFGNSVLICNLLEFPGLVDAGWLGVRSVEFIVLTSWGMW
ncbi:hypothetical protein Droror1_Dr00008793 [Drosera rotundifolia]